MKTKELSFATEVHLHFDTLQEQANTFLLNGMDLLSTELHLPLGTLQEQANIHTVYVNNIIHE